MQAKAKQQPTSAENLARINAVNNVNPSLKKFDSADAFEAFVSKNGCKIEERWGDHTVTYVAINRNGWTVASYYEFWA